MGSARKLWSAQETLPQPPAHPSTWIDGNCDMKNPLVAKNVKRTGTALLVVLQGEEVFITYDTRMILSGEEIVGVERRAVLYISDTLLKCIDVSNIKVLGCGNLLVLAHMVRYTQKLVEEYIAEGQVGPILLHLATHFNNWRGLGEVPVSDPDSSLIFVDPTVQACGYRLLQIQAAGDGVSIHYPERWVAAGSAASMMTDVMMEEATIVNGRGEKILVDPEYSMSRAMQTAFSHCFDCGGIAIMESFTHGVWSEKTDLAGVNSVRPTGWVEYEDGTPPHKIVEFSSRGIEDLLPFHLFHPV